MIYNQYKYELLSIINMELDKKNYNNKIIDCLSSFSSFIKDLEYEIDDTSSNIRNSLTNNKTNEIDHFLYSLKRSILNSI